MMDSCLAAHTFASTAFNTFSGVTQRLIPGISIPAAGLGQDEFWQKGNIILEQLSKNKSQVGSLCFAELCAPLCGLLVPPSLQWGSGSGVESSGTTNRHSDAFFRLP